LLLGALVASAFEEVTHGVTRRKKKSNRVKPEKQKVSFVLMADPLVSSYSSHENPLKDIVHVFQMVFETENLSDILFA